MSKIMMKPVGDYLKIQKVEKPTTQGKIITSLESVNPPFEEYLGILVYDTEVGGEKIKAKTQVLYTNPVFDRKEEDKTFAYVNKKFLIAYGR